MFDFDAIDADINKAIEALHASTPRASARRIRTGTYVTLLPNLTTVTSPADAHTTPRKYDSFVPNSYAARLYNLVAAAKPTDVRATLREYGGFVPNSYAARLYNLVAAAKPTDVRATLREYGGFVPNSYMGKTETDRLDVTLDLRTCEVTIDARRAPAPRRAHGNGELLTMHLCAEGQTQGRRV